MSRFGKNNWSNNANSSGRGNFNTSNNPSSPNRPQAPPPLSSNNNDYYGKGQKRKANDITPGDDELPGCACETKQCVEKKTSGPNAKNPNREFFTCNACGGFLWVDDWDGNPESKLTPNKSKQYGKKTTTKIVPTQNNELMEKLDKMDSGLLCIHQTMEAIQQQTDETYPLVVKLVEVIQRLENSLQDLHMKVDLLKISK
jgi:hypothetical protein